MSINQMPDYHYYLMQDIVYLLNIWGKWKIQKQKMETEKQKWKMEMQKMLHMLQVKCPCVHGYTSLQVQFEILSCAMCTSNGLNFRFWTFGIVGRMTISLFY